MKTRVFHTLAGLAAASTLLTAGTSSAAAEPGDSVSITTNGGRAKFFDDGDVLAVYDDRADGYGVRAYLRWHQVDGDPDSVLTNVVEEVDGAGNKEVVNLSIPDGKTVWLQMCYLGKDGEDATCSGTQSGEA